MKTAIEAFREDDPVNVVAMRMRDVGTGFVPVCDVHGRPLGTVTDYDIVSTVCADDRLASKTLVGEIMRRDFVICYADDDISVAEGRMEDSHKARVLVLDRHQKLAGVVSLADLFRTEEDRRALDSARHIVEREYLA